MSHDTDKLIRQLSLVAFLMAERRPLTARDVKSNVEGYSEMSDEAFARRFYSDRAELLALGVPLQSQRDEFTGEELYTLRSENYFLDKLELDDDQLEEHLQLLNLVNFGGGCYTVYAALDGDKVHVDKELYGDTFRHAPRLTPLEARAIRLALEFVGPMIAADAHTPLDRVRRKLEETFGQFELAQTPEPHVTTEEEELIATFSRAIRDHTLVEIEYQKEAEQRYSRHLVEPYKLEREGRAAVRHRLNVERSAVCLRDRARDEEAEAGAGLRGGAPGTAELLEDQSL